MAMMKAELFWLTLTTVLTGLLWVPYILDRAAVRGLMGAMVTAIQAFFATRPAVAQTQVR